MIVPPRVIVLSAVLATLAWVGLGSASPAGSARPMQGTTWTTGAVGTLGDVVYPPGNYLIDLASEGLYDPVLWVVILDYNTLTIQNGATVRFLNHPSRAPVVIRAVGPIVVDGVLNLDGAYGSISGFPSHAEPGPGGFRGGHGAIANLSNKSDGFGPGGAYALSDTSTQAASGSHATPGSTQAGGVAGPSYGSAFASPLIGGSGGTGYASYNGGAGGGAVLIGSNESLHLGGTISAIGGANQQSPVSSIRGSGGTVRIAAPIVSWSGPGTKINAFGGPGSTGAGRIRIEMIGSPPNGNVPSSPGASHSVQLGEFLSTNQPTVTVLAWWDEVTGAWVGLNQDPRAVLDDASQADVRVPSVGLRTLRLQGVGVPAGAPLEVRMTRADGRAILDTTSYTMGTAGSGPMGELYTDVVVDIQLGVSAVQVRAVLP